MPRQKLVTIYLRADNSAYDSTKHTHQHGVIESHLEKELSDGWQIKSINLTGESTPAWIAVLMEKN